MMRFFKANIVNFRGMRLSFKLTLSFLLLVVIIGITGGAGLLVINKIQGKIGILSEVASPLVNITGELGDTLQRAHIASLEVLTLRDEQAIQKQTKLVKELEGKFRENLERLPAISAKGNIHFDTQTVDDTQQKLFKHARELIAAHQTKITKSTAGLKAFEKQRIELYALLNDFGNRAHSAVNEKEDRGKTLVQSGDATLEDMWDLLDNLFSQDYLFVQGAANLQRYLMHLQDISRAYINEHELEKLKAIEKKFQSNFKKVNSRLKRLKSRVKSEENKRDFKAVVEGFAKLKDIVLLEHGLFAVHREYLEASSNVERLRELLVSAGTDSKLALLEIMETAGKLNENARLTANTSVRQAQMNIGSMVAVGVIIGILCTWLITRSITKPLGRVIKSLTAATDQVASSSSQISSFSQQLAEGSSEQAASIEETSSSLEEMSSMTKQNAENAAQVDSLTNEADQVVGQANGSMVELTGSMQEISNASEDISKIIKTIDEIAFQTNLLALNAAVEAARAGEAGAGFAVVADEVRNLAMRAAEAAKDTAELIEGTVKKVKDGSELVTRTNEAFTQVADTSSKVGDLVGEIAAASKEQAQGIEQVNTTVTEMDKVTQQNAVNAEESASASVGLNAQAEQMKGIVNDLVVLVGGKNKSAAKSSAAAVKAPKQPVHRLPIADAKAAEEKEPVVHHAKEIIPEQVVPLDDQDFKDF